MFVFARRYQVSTVRVSGWSRAWVGDAAISEPALDHRLTPTVLTYRDPELFRMKKVIKRILLVLLVLLVLAQVPFIYRRYQTGKLAEKIAQLETQRIANPDFEFKEYKGIIHAHTNIGGHSTGTF